MKNNIFITVSLNIIYVFGTMILVSFIPDYFHVFFGDIYENGYHGCTELNFEWTWGWRHWVWVFMGICLFIVQAARIISMVDKHLTKKP